MSLHKFAEQVASQGRGDDSLLVHMTPDEVRNLQRFAEANGTTLTINPTTGLPEAGLLSDLFKAVAPIALGAFLGPAGMGLTFGGLSSAMSAGIATGGITALATGSLSRGLMAGLGAYGGAGLGEGLMGAATTGDAFQAAQSNLGPEANAMSVRDVAATANINPVTSGFQALGTEQGRTAALNAMGGTKGALTAAGMAAAPLMAMQPTTKMPDPKDTGYIRQFDFNINPDTGKPDPLYGVRAMTPVKASEFGNKTFQGQRDLFRQQNPNPYELGVGSLNQPPQQLQQTTPMATGGIVALAGGGDIKHFAIGDLVKADIDKAYAAGDYAKVNELAQENKITAADVASTYQGFDTSGLAGLGINLYTPDTGGGGGGGGGSGAPTYTQYSDQDFGAHLAKYPNADLAKDLVTYNADPAAFNRYIASLTSPFVGSTDTKGGSGTLGIYNEFNRLGVSPDEYYAAALANDPKYGGWDKGMIQKAYNLDKGAYALAAAEKDGVSDKEWVNFMDTNKYSIDDMAQAFGLSRNEVRDRYNAVKAAETKVVTKDTVTGGTGNDVITDTDTGTGTGTTPQTYAPPGTTNPYGNVYNPGDLTFNADGSTTVQPNIPGRPYGGFVGIQQLKDAYTRGGGSLGYTARAPKTKAEFDQLYNRQTGDSLAAYDYLMGKGSGKYPFKSGAPKIAENYAESVLGKKTVGLKPITKTTGTGTTTFKAPETYFDEKAYLAANPDVEAEMKAGKSNFASAYEHYLRYGKAEGRKFAGDYDSYLAAVEAEKARAVQQESGGDGNAAPPGPDASSPANSDAGNTVAKQGGLMGYAMGGGLGSLGSYSDGGRLLKGPGDGVSDSIPATIGAKNQPARLADGEFVIPARIVSELGNGSTDAGAKKLYAMMDRVQRARGKTTGKNKVAANSRADKYLPA